MPPGIREKKTQKCRVFGFRIEIHYSNAILDDSWNTGNYLACIIPLEELSDLRLRASEGIMTENSFQYAQLSTYVILVINNAKSILK